MAEAQRQYEVIDHTADLGLRVFAGTREELFSRAARAMFDQIADLNSIRVEVRRSLTVEASGWEELLVCFLSELLYLFTGEDMLLRKFTLKRMDDRHLEVEAGGEKFSASRHQLKTEIKAVTYHNLKIERRERGWQVEIIFDTGPRGRRKVINSPPLCVGATLVALFGEETQSAS